MQKTLGVILMGFLSTAQAAVPIKPASREANDEAAQVARRTFSSAEELKKSTLVADAVAIGPRLWAASLETRKRFKDDTKDMYAVVSQEIVKQWQLTPLDMESLPDAVRPAVAEAAKSGTPVLTGSLFRRSSEIFATLVLAQLEASDFPMSVRRPTDTEIAYYWALIPYDLAEPIWVVQGKSHAFLCHFDNSGRVFYFEKL
jgi:hypothetical protein